jgi:hypothetical protein
VLSVPHFHQAPCCDFGRPDLYVSTLTSVLTRLVSRLSNGEMMTLLPSTEYMVLATNLLDALGDTTTGKRQLFRRWDWNLTSKLQIRFYSSSKPSLGRCSLPPSSWLIKKKVNCLELIFLACES